jgi:hypothetical protein
MRRRTEVAHAMTNWLEMQPGLGRYTAEFRLDEDGEH